MDYKEKVIAMLNSKELSQEQKEKSEDERIRKTLIHIVKGACDKYGIKYQAKEISEEKLLAWIEKQGEKTEPIEDFDTEFERQISHLIASAINREHEYNKGYIKWAAQSLIEYAKHEIEKQGEQKPADKIDPKFKVGNWIIKNDDSSINIDYSCCKITKVENGNYTIESIYGYKSYNTFETFEKDYHLWTIQDAKDGDVLCCKSGWTCIFKALDNHTNTFSSYCFMDSDKWFCNTGSEGHTLDKAFIKAYNGEIHPATKEQRGLLFQKMKEAGYEWDAEKKELKKMEQKPALSEEDEEMYEEVLTDIIYAKNNLKAKECHGLSKRAMEAFNWFSNRYKSLRPQSTWRPSEEQMKVLNEVLNFAANHESPHWNDYIFGTLNNLIIQLKKLRED